MNKLLIIENDGGIPKHFGLTIGALIAERAISNIRIFTNAKKNSEKLANEIVKGKYTMIAFCPNVIDRKQWMPIITLLDSHSQAYGIKEVHIDYAFDLEREMKNFLSYEDRVDIYNLSKKLAIYKTHAKLPYFDFESEKMDIDKIF